MHFELPGFTAEDEFFHIAPGGTRTIALRRARAGTMAAPRGSVHALNTWAAVPLKVVP